MLGLVVVALAALGYVVVGFDVVDEGEGEMCGAGECDAHINHFPKSPVVAVVEDSGRRLSDASPLGREIRPVEGSARVLREGVWVDKGEWC